MRFAKYLLIGLMSMLSIISAQPAVETPQASEEIKIVSLAPNVTETIFALGKGESIVGRTQYCDYPKEALEIPSIGDLYSPNIEMIVALEPDFIICSSLVSDDIKTKLTELGLNLISINAEGSINGTYNLIREIGKTIQAEEEAENLILDMQTKIANLSDKTKNITTKKKVYYCVGYGEYGDFTATGDTFISNLLNTAGCINVAEDSSFWSISKEDLIASDPEIILMPFYPYSNFENDKTALMTMEPYNNISACKKGMILPIDGNIMDRQGPRIVNAIDAIIKAVYPNIK